MESYYLEVFEKCDFIEKIVKCEEEIFVCIIDVGSGYLDLLFM